jgi:hypothetical protein
MGFKFGGQSILNDLVLYLDASNPISYPGSGNIWFDISGRSNHFNLQNSPTNNGIGFSFNGSNQYASCQNTTCGNFGTGNFTIEYIVDYTTTSTYSTIIAKRGTVVSLGAGGYAGYIHRIGATQFTIQDNIQTGTPSPPNGAVNSTGVQNFTSGIVVANERQHIIQTLNNNGTTMVGKLYKNGVLRSTAQYNYSNYNATIPGSVNNSNNILLMLGPGTGTYLQGNLYFVRLYNKELSQAEITYNYNSIRGKYGI